jgi:hypothetical protein
MLKLDRTATDSQLRDLRRHAADLRGIVRAYQTNLSG